MWGIVFLMLALGSAGSMAESSVMGRLSWCSTLCMCETQTKTDVQCFEEDDVYQLLDFNPRAIARLKRINWNLESKVVWCNDTCLCNIQTGKVFECAQPQKIIQIIVDRIGTEYFILPEEDSEIKQETERSVDEEEEPSVDEEMAHRRRSERKKKKNRKQKKNQKKHRNQSEESHEPEPEPEPHSEPEPGVHVPTSTVLPTMLRDTPTPTSFIYHHEKDAEEIDTHEQLPRHQAVAASPDVTAMHTPSRKFLPYSTAESYTPSELEGLSPRVQPVVEVPKEKKTMASMVSQDLDDLGTTVRNIKNDVMLNQRILLVTVAIAGIAMLGVLILAIMNCTSRRQQAANNAKKNSNKDGNHSPKINLEEAW